MMKTMMLALLCVLFLRHTFPMLNSMHVSSMKDCVGVFRLYPHICLCRSSESTLRTMLNYASEKKIISAVLHCAAMFIQLHYAKLNFNATQHSMLLLIHESRIYSFDLNVSTSALFLGENYVFHAYCTVIALLHSLKSTMLNMLA